MRVCLCVCRGTVERLIQSVLLTSNKPYFCSQVCRTHMSLVSRRSSTWDVCRDPLLRRSGWFFYFSKEVIFLYVWAYHPCSRETTGFVWLTSDHVHFFFLTKGSKRQPGNAKLNLISSKNSRLQHILMSIFCNSSSKCKWQMRCSRIVESLVHPSWKAPAKSVLGSTCCTLTLRRLWRFVHNGCRDRE